MWIDTVVLESQSRIFLATQILNLIAVHQNISIDYTFVWEYAREDGAGPEVREC